MKIKKVNMNNRKSQIELTTRSGKKYPFPYAELDPRPTPQNRIKQVYVDKELAQSGVTYFLESGEEGALLLDHALSYNRDPAYVTNTLLYSLTRNALKHIDTTHLSRREIARRLNTSLSQLYRLLDPTNYKKDMGQMIQLLHVLGLDVELTTKPKGSRRLDRAKVFLGLLDRLTWGKLLKSVSTDEQERLEKELEACRLAMTDDEQEELEAFITDRQAVTTKRPLDMIDRDPDEPVSDAEDPLRQKVAA